MSNLQSVYSKILTLLHKIEDKDNFIRQIRTPKLSDKALLALSLAAESLGIDFEHFLIKIPGASPLPLNFLVLRKRGINKAVFFTLFTPQEAGNKTPRDLSNYHQRLKD